MADSRSNSYRPSLFYRPLSNGDTTYNSLVRTLIETKTEYKPIPGFNMNRDDTLYYRRMQEIDCDEVYPGIFIGDASTAKNREYLMRIGVTHVVNAAEGNRFGHVNTNQNYYSTTPIKYLGLPLTDLPSVDISQYFNVVANFIDDAIRSGGKVFVHCMLGISRSSTCVIAFLMIKRNMTAEEAIRLVRKSRDVHPNDGFLHQLASLDNQLRRSRSYL
ncbi:dual specificity protein phosphatase 3 [Chelonus insularis]|uniref:dual specificity protein phosphatase 3 n=1 Tax=Chelonus insularis TaxID=460826 RepID=UPI001588C37D|nr:dual specificity protein phosphatase 3 [Chelonus insularis]